MLEQRQASVDAHESGRKLLSEEVSIHTLDMNRTMFYYGPQVQVIFHRSCIRYCIHT